MEHLGLDKKEIVLDFGGKSLKEGEKPRIFQACHIHEHWKFHQALRGCPWIQVLVPVPVTSAPIG